MRYLGNIIFGILAAPITIGIVIIKTAITHSKVLFYLFIWDGTDE
jgi:hypothetical protein